MVKIIIRWSCDGRPRISEHPHGSYQIRAWCHQIIHLSDNGGFAMGILTKNSNFVLWGRRIYRNPLAFKPNTCPRFLYPVPSKMAKEVFSVPIFIIVFRETLEAAIIVSVLLSLIEQLVTGSTSPPATPPSEATRNSDADSKDVIETRLPTTLVEDDSIQRRRLLRKMRIQVNHFSAPTSWPYR
jgi:hypothetical protein